MPQFQHGLFDWRIQPGQEGYRKPAAPRPALPPITQQYQQFAEGKPTSRPAPAAPDMLKSFTVLPTHQTVVPPNYKPPLFIEGVQFDHLPNAAEQAAILEAAKAEKIEGSKRGAIAATLAIFSLVPFAEVSPLASKALGRKGLAVNVERTALGTRIRPTRFALLYAAPQPLGLVPPEEFGLPPDYLGTLSLPLPQSEVVATKASTVRAQAFALRVRSDELRRQAFIVGNTYSGPDALALAEAIQSGRYGVLTPEERATFLADLRRGVESRPNRSEVQPILDALAAIPTAQPVDPQAVTRTPWTPADKIPPQSAATANWVKQADENQKQLLVQRADP